MRSDSNNKKSMWAWLSQTWGDCHRHVQNTLGLRNVSRSQFAGFYHWPKSDDFTGGALYARSQYLVNVLLLGNSMSEMNVNTFIHRSFKQKKLLSYGLYEGFSYLIYAYSYMAISLNLLFHHASGFLRFQCPDDALSREGRLDVARYYSRTLGQDDVSMFQRMMNYGYSFRQYRLVAACMLLWNVLVDVALFAPRFAMSILGVCSYRVCDAVKTTLGCLYELESLVGGMSRYKLSQSPVRGRKPRVNPLWKDMVRYVIPLMILSVMYIDFGLLLSFSAIPAVAVLLMRALQMEWSNKSNIFGKVHDFYYKHARVVHKVLMTYLIMMGSLVLGVMIAHSIKPIVIIPAAYTVFEKMAFALCASIALLSLGPVNVSRRADSHLWNAVSLLFFAMTLSSLPLWMSVCLCVSSSTAYNAVYHVYDAARVYFQLLCTHSSAVVVLAVNDVLVQTVLDGKQYMMPTKLDDINSPGSDADALKSTYFDQRVDGYKLGDGTQGLDSELDDKLGAHAGAGLDML